MRKLFTLFTMCLLATAAWGQTVITFVAGETVGQQPSVSTEDEMSLDGITIHTTYGAFAAAQYRFGKNSTTTVTSSVGNIVKIEFVCTTDNPASGFSEPAGMEDGVWEGSEGTVTFVAGNKQVRATKIIVTVDGGGLSAPSIKPAAGTYYNPIEVNITCSTRDAKIYYTLDGSNPTVNSTRFTAPFTLNKNTTVKAISALDGDVSDVVEAVYEFATATPVASIAEFTRVADGTVVVFTNPVSVLAQSGSRMFVQDNSGATLFFGALDVAYKNGDVIPAGFVGTKTTYDSEPELKDLKNFQPASSNTPIQPTTITASQVDASRFARLVYLENVTFDKDNHLVIDASGQAPYYCNMNVKEADIVPGTEYKLKAIVGSYGKENPVYQLLPVEIKKVNPGPGFGFANMFDTADNTEVTFDYDATVIIQSGATMYAKDETGYGLIYGTINQSYRPGDVIPSGFSGTKATYNAEPELKNGKGFGSSIDHVNIDAQAEVILANQVNHSTWAHYVKFTNATITMTTDVDGTLTDNKGNTCPIYNKTFGAALPTDGKAYTVYGIVASYQKGGQGDPVYQILPVKVEGVQDIPEPVANIAELFNLPSGTKGKFTTPLTTIYQNGKYLYVKDVNNKVSLAFGTLTNTFVNGDYINDAIAGWSLYYDYPQLTPVDSTFVKAGHGSAVKPTEKVIEDINQNDINNYLVIKDVEIMPTDDAMKFTMLDENGDELLIYNRFDYTMPEIESNATYNVEGFMGIFKTDRQFYPIKVSKAGALKGDVNGDGVVNISDVNVLINIILGATLDSETMKRADVNEDQSINIGDINAVIAIILN